MNILTDFEAHKRDEDFDREDARRHRETCSPAGSCYVPFVDGVRGEQHYCDIHRPGVPIELSTPLPGTDPKLFARFMAKVHKTETCWIWTGGATREGYGKTSVGYASIRAHRLAWTFFAGPIPDGMNVLHHCDNPPCVRFHPEHLFLGTTAQNVADRNQKGRDARGDGNGARLHPERLARGERQGRARLTATMVSAIRSAETQIPGTRRALALRFGVSEATIQQVISGKTWAHVSEVSA